MDRRLECTRLGELPEDCIAKIFAHTSHWDVARLACVSRAFASAARSDTVWNMLLPSDYALIYPHAQQCQRKRDIVEALSRGVSLAKGTQRYLLLRRSPGVCRFLSSTSMSIRGGGDGRFWRWDYSKSSYFSKVAHLLAVCTLEVSGTWTCSIPPGTYSVTWRLRVANPQGGRHRYLSWKRPVSFIVTTTPGGQVLERQLDLGHMQSDDFQQWFEYEVGQIVVGGERMMAQELELQFSITELDNSFWKGGMFIDCLLVRPARTEDSEHIFARDSEQELYKRRIRCGVF